MSSTTTTSADPVESAAPRDARRRWGRRLSDWVDPKNTILAVLVILGAGLDGLRGVGWALFATLFAAVLPTLFIRYGVRTDRHVTQRHRRLVVIPFIMASVAVCFLSMLWLGAPRAMTALVVAMFATLVPIMAITTRWKVSVHTAVLGGAVTVLAIALSLWWLLGAALLAAVAWGRVTVEEHTRAQTLVGTVVGALTAGLTFWLAR
ncbi:hypothetical protein [Streptacidiphilus sp. P02-A3a]|uniref:hypothetical protein n=1 Tax=Streptacidiphilus sp. P02-A3a TaxID=2704468 RepID=UPI001CDB5A90|nr:hypothetical protein [Streptacidiphilus sp. P02-A3a]